MENKKSRRKPTLLDYLQIPKKPLVENKIELKKKEEEHDEIEEIITEINHTNGGKKEEKDKVAERKKHQQIVLWFNRIDNASIQDCYLMSYYYDPEQNKALLAFYDPSSDTIKYWYDKTEHKPYFLVKEAPDEIEKLIPASHKQRFIGTENIVKTNLLKMKKETFTKIIVKDPLAVRELRDRFRDSWESNIRYHQNYLYDRMLTPGMRYNVNGKNLRIKTSSNGLHPELMDIFRKEEQENLLFAKEIYPLFEEEAPMPRIAAIDIEVFSPFETRLPDVKTAPYPVLSIAIATSDENKTVLVLDYPLASKSKLTGKEEYDLMIFDSEKALIQEAFKLISQYPVILTYNGDRFDLPYLKNRARKLGFKEEEIPLVEEQDYYTLKTGIHLDLFSIYDNRALKTYAFGGSYRENSLNSVAEAILGVGKIQIEENPSLLGIKTLTEYNYRDAYLTLELLKWKNYLPWKLLILLSRLTKTGLEELSRSQISMWIRNMLYWEHRKNKYLIPKQEDILSIKSDIKSRAIIKGKKYAGAIVLDPPIGVFFNVYVLDFASLYPSIIKVWNLSYETVNPVYPCKDLRTVPDVGHKVCFDRKGMISKIIGVLRDLRVKVYKRKTKDKNISPDRREWYNAVQSAMKVLLNASYGVFGSDNFALYAPPVAESVTAIGRFIITKTVEKAEEMGLKVLYGDTDSMFIWSPPKEKIQRLIKIIEEENNLDLEIDKVFKYIAFSGLKKNYLGVSPKGDVEIKGMLGKKRNQPEFIKKAFKDVIHTLVEVEKPSDFLNQRDRIKNEIKRIYRRLKQMDYNLDELAFNVMLNKSVKEYTKTTPQHVKAAILLEPFGKKLSRGDIISYVKVKNKEGVKPVQLAKLTEIDVEKYIEALRSTFEQVLQSINIEWEEIEGIARLESFFMTKK